MIDRDNMGHFDPNANHVVQELDSAIGGLFGTAGYFDGQLFYGGDGDHLKAFQVTNGQLSTSPASQSTNAFNFPGTLPTVSANGTSGGIAWAQDTSDTGSPAVLHAYDATNLGNELYNSAEVSSRDQAGLAVHFASPTVADGKVYVGTRSELDVYGLLPAIADAGFEQVQVGAGQFQYRPDRLSLDLLRQFRHLRQQQRLHLGQPAGPPGHTGRLPPGNRLVQPDRHRLGRRLLRAHLRRRPARQPPGVEAGLRGAGRRRGRGHVHTLRHVVSDLLHLRVHRHGRVAHDHLPGPGQCRRRQHRLRRRGRLRPARAPIGDPGFEQVQVGAGQFQYRPTGSPWTFTGSSGISANNSGFTSGNPPAPQGTQVAFLQGTGSFSQTVTGWAAGSYVLTFDAAQRGNNQASQQDFEVLVDGVVVGTFTPSGTSYQTYTTAAFTVTAGSHTITFQGLDSCRRRQHRLRRRRRRAASRRRDRRPGFRAGAGGGGPVPVPARPALPGPSPAAAGISANNSGFTSGNPPAPEGAQVAFLQGTGSFSQTRHRLGRRLLRAHLRRRPARQLPGVASRTSRCWSTAPWSAPSHPPARRTRLTPPPRSPSPPGRTRSRSRAWTAPAATTPPSSTPCTAASLATIGDAGFEQVQVGAGQFQYRPTGSPWTFTGSSGISANNSGFTSGNPPAPEGTQVAFLQGTGSFSQIGHRLGRRLLRADLRRRPARQHQASKQDFEVLVDGTVVGDVHSLRHVVPDLHDRRVHRHRRVAHDHVPGPGQRRRRQHRLRRSSRRYLIRTNSWFSRINRPLISGG